MEDERSGWGIYERKGGGELGPGITLKERKHGIAGWNCDPKPQIGNTEIERKGGT